MESNGHSSIGLLPEELVQIIVHHACLQAVWSFCLANRFWLQKLRHLVAHPKILIIEYCGIYRKIFLLKGGFAHQTFLSSDGKAWGSQLNLKRVYKSKLLQLKRGWFDSVPDLQAFLREFRSIVTENAWEAIYIARPKLSFIVNIQHDDPNVPQYYASKVSEGFSKLNDHAFGKLTKLIDEAKFVMPEQAKRNDDGISLMVQYLQKTRRMFCDMFINTEGDINAIIETKNGVSIEFQTRTSPALFQQLEEIIVYPKHKKQLDELANDNAVEKLHNTASEYATSIFNLQCDLEDKKYFVQEWKVIQDGQTVVQNNGYKTGTIKKIMKILEPLFIGKADGYFLKDSEIVSAQPEFSGYQLIRQPRYKLPTDKDLPSIVAIDLTVKNGTTYSLTLQGKVSVTEVLSLFERVANAINYNDTDPHTYTLDVCQHERVEQVKIHSLKSFKPITKLSNHLIRRVWFYICLNRGVKNPYE